MRKIIDVQPCFFNNLRCDQKIIETYREKYNRISDFLDETPKVLDLVHNDLKKLSTSNGRDSEFSSEQLLRILLVKCIENITYEDVIIRVSDSDFLRNFTRINTGKIMSKSLVCTAFKSIQIPTWYEINKIISNKAHKEGKISSRSLRVDSTVCRTNIHYPTDSFLLWDVYRVVSRLIKNCNQAEPKWWMGFRFHLKKIKKLYTFISTHASKKNKSTKRKVKRDMRKLIKKVREICEKSEFYIENAESILSINRAPASMLKELKHYVYLGHKVVDQADRIYNLGEKVPAKERIFSIFEEHTELIKRGKAGCPIEFGHMVTIGQTKEKFISFYDVEEKSQHDTELKDVALESHKDMFGEYPENFTADKNYYKSMDDIKDWENKIPNMAIGKKGRRNKEEIEREHSSIFTDLQRFRAGIEGTISVLKRALGFKMPPFKGFKSFATSIGYMIVSYNLLLLTRL